MRDEVRREFSGQEILLVRIYVRKNPYYCMHNVQWKMSESVVALAATGERRTNIPVGATEAPRREIGDLALGCLRRGVLRA